MPPPVQTAATITIPQTLALLDGDLAGVAQGVGRGEYALWLGSGISRDRIVGLDGVLRKLIEFLRTRATADAACPYRMALDDAIRLAEPSGPEKAQINYAVDSANWPCLSDLLRRLAKVYSRVLSVKVEGCTDDYLLWEGLDFTETFAHQEPDAEHLAVGILALEGVVTDMASANWDGLLEAAVRELGHGVDFYRVCVTGRDFRGPAASARLYKFHGCALRAIEDEATYRPLLISRVAQIAAWSGLPAFAMMRDQLTGLAARARTLMIGLSAQDANIQQLFVQAAVQQVWPWNDEPPPHVFAEDQLQDDQKTLLEVSYRADYNVNRPTILNRARIPAFAKALLPALVLHVLCEKVTAFMRDSEGPNLTDNDRDVIAEGIRRLRDLAAQAGDSDRLDLVRRIAHHTARVKCQLQQGRSPAGNIPYTPLITRPVHQIPGDANLIPTGQREAAAGFGLLGLGERDGDWTVGLDDPADPRSGAVRIASPNGEARIIFVGHSILASRLLYDGVYSEDDDDVVLIHSTEIILPQQRTPSRSLRAGNVGARHIDIGQLIRAAPDLARLRDQFREGLSV